MSPRPLRRPRFGPFLGTGAVAGALLAVVPVLLQPPNAAYGRGQAILFLALMLGVVGALLGGGVAVLLDDRAERRRSSP